MHNGYAISGIHMCMYICASSGNSGMFGKVLVLSFFLDLMLNSYSRLYS